MNQSEQINELASALSKMQGLVGSVTKNKTVKIPTKNGNSFSYTYADLAGIWEAIRKPLSESGLCITQTFCDKTLVTLLMHSSGQWIKSSLPLSRMGSTPQELGSEITYLKRYALSSILGISADEDDDGIAAQDAAKRTIHQDPSMASPEASQSTITPEQAKDLKIMLAACAGDYQKSFMNSLRNSSGNIRSIEDLPASLFMGTWKAVSKKAQEYQERSSHG